MSGGTGSCASVTAQELARQAELRRQERARLAQDRDRVQEIQEEVLDKFLKEIDRVEKTGFVEKLRDHTRQCDESR